MAENRYSFVRRREPNRGIDRLEIQIVKWDLGYPVREWDLSQRLSRFWLIYWNDTPGALLKFRERSIEMVPGKMVLIPPYTLVSAETRAPFVHNFVEFEAAHPFKLVKSRPLEFPAGEFAPRLDPGADGIRVSLALYILVERLLLQIPQEYFSSQSDFLFEPRIRQVLKYMDGHPMKRYSVEVLADQANLSVSRLLHLFKKETGITPRQYWLKQQMELILRLLQETELSIAEIAEETGFVDRSHLSRVVKAEFRMTPAAIRKKAGSGRTIPVADGKVKDPSAAPGTERSRIE